MKQYITSENYEAFYLDYIEGNLSNEETTALKLFFIAHPEFQLEDESLVELSLDDSIKLSAFEKELLKKDSDKAIVTSSNAEFFLVSELEGTIYTSQQKQLDALVANSKALQTEQKLYAKTILPSETLIYGNKSTLVQKKKGRIIPFWMIGSSVAAASIALFILFRAPETSQNTSKSQQTIAKNKKEVFKFPSKNNLQNKINNASQTPVFHHINIDKQDNITNNNLWPSAELLQKEIENGAPQPEFAYIEKENRNEIAPKETNKLPNNLPLIAPNNEENGNAYAQVKTNETPNIDLAAENGLTGLYNPIPMITRTMSERLNTTVEFKKNRDKTKKGFFLKIGKLIIDRTK